MTLTLDTEKTVGQMVTERPARSRVFEKLGIDFCCGGKVLFAEACGKQGLDPHTVLQMLDLDTSSTAGQAVDPSALTLTELADHIEATHHVWVRRELPRTGQLLEKVASVHGDKFPWLTEMLEVFTALREEMFSHMAKEEQILFPLIRQIEAGTPLPPAMLLGIESPVHCMESEHESAGRAIATLRSLSDGFTPPAEACNTFRAMLDALAEFEADLHMHVHKENNILFPRAIELGRAKVAAMQG